MDTDFKLIETTAALNSFCEHLVGKSWIAIDTEFLREKTYYPRLCLIQLASDEKIACIDPLKINDLSSFNRLMINPEVTKVFHSAAQDMETLQQATGTLPTPIFDTQIAAALLGQGDQIGYAALVEKLLGIRLAKTQTRTDWSRRPLSPAQLHYAADDVRHLREIYERQLPLLEELGRTEWEREEAAKLESADKYQPQSALLLRRVKGQHGLPVRERAIIRELALWREGIAAKKDLPRKWILADDALLEIAHAEIRSSEDLKAIPSLTPRIVKQHGEALLKIVSRIRALDDATLAALIPQRHLTPAENAKVKKIQKMLAEIAAEAGITQSLIASRKDIEHLVQVDRNIPLMESWRYQVAGQTVEKMLGVCRT